MNTPPLAIWFGTWFTQRHPLAHICRQLARALANMGCVVYVHSPYKGMSTLYEGDYYSYPNTPPREPFMAIAGDREPLPEGAVARFLLDYDGSTWIENSDQDQRYLISGAITFSSTQQKGDRGGY